MSELAQQKCLACAAPNEPILTEAQIAELQPQVPDEWQVKQVNGMQHGTNLQTLLRIGNTGYRGEI